MSVYHCKIQHSLCQKFVLSECLLILLLWLISDSDPRCGPLAPRSFLDEDQSVDFTCSMTYSWHSSAQQSNVVPLINVFFGWVQNEDETPPLITRLPSMGATRSEEANLTVASARKPSVPSQICKLSFTFSAQTHYSRFSFAVNPVSHQCITDPIPVRRKYTLYICVLVYYVLLLLLLLLLLLRLHVCLICPSNWTFSALILVCSV